ncbi:hypothetical protein [Streptomyces griseus]|uniref:hypothetical protein n=1 Tax=Streptomyces griseus TaxID=1911 RepID=UPI0004C731BB|nr:hypothetical protein [Streptomyces griseus]
MRRRKQPVLVAVALCLGGALTACGGGDGGGFTAVGAGPSPGGAVGPSGAVELVPLETPTASGTISSTSSPPPKPPEAPGTPGATRGGPGPTTSPAAPHPAAAGGGTGAGPGPDSGTGSGSGGRTETAGAPGGGSPSPGATTAPTRTAPAPATPSSTPPAPRPGTGAPAPGPAAVTVSAPVTADGDTRWCERVTVTFRNTGGSPATSGTVSFGTHVIGLLGLDWSTVTTSRPLPVPIAAGASRKQTYTVCVEEWRVPLGMRVDTREVTVSLR